ncbi:unnamed protein product [Phaeothamnion confervicola]
MAPVSFGQVVVGPPGSGKTTYCNGMQQYMTAIGRDCAIVNLDPANHGETLPYKADVDIEELASLEDVMREFDLGPNGGLMYCVEYLEKNLDWLFERLNALEGKYLLFDFPGQVELFTHCDSVRRIVGALGKRGCRLTAVNLVDAFHCGSASRFVSAALLSLMTMLRLELPQVSVLSKVDMLANLGELPFNLDFYMDCLDLRQILDYFDEDDDDDNGDGDGEENGGEYEKGGDDKGYQASPAVDERDDDADADRGSGGIVDNGSSSSRHGERSVPNGGDGCGAADSGEEQLKICSSGSKAADLLVAATVGAAVLPRRGRGSLRGRLRLLHAELCDVLDGFGLVSFHPLHIEDGESVGRLLAQVDRSNGYSLPAATGGGGGSGFGGGVFGGNGGVGDEGPGAAGYVNSLFRTAFGEGEMAFERAMAVQERYMDTFQPTPPPMAPAPVSAAGREGRRGGGDDGSTM